MPPFKYISLSSAETIQNFVNEFEPYSDFNFLSLYSWSLHSQAKYSMNENCLFIILPDYNTQQLQYTFLSKENHIQNLLIFAKWQNDRSIINRFNLVSEDNIRELSTGLSALGYTFSVNEDRDSFDYILNVAKFTSLYGSEYSDIRYKLSRYDRDWGDKITEVKFNPKNNEDARQAMLLADRWIKAKGDVLYSDEIYAFARFLNAAGRSKSVVFKSLVIDEKIVGLVSYEILNSDYAIGHFIKYDREYKGIYHKLVHLACMDLIEKGVKYINIEQDLGNQGLRIAKEHLNPEKYLKKYTLILN